MKSKIEQAVGTLYLIVYLSYVLSMAACIAFLFLESFTYLGFSFIHFGIKPDALVWISLFLGFVISIVPIMTLDKVKKWQFFYKKHFNINAKIFIFILLFTLLLNLVERLVYDNFVFSMIHFQPLLLYKVLILTAISMYVSLSLVIRSGGGDKTSLLFKLKNNDIKLSASIIQKTLLVLYSIMLIVIMVINSSKFVYKFYQPDTSFLKEYELKYVRGEIDITEWIDIFFPQTTDLIKWCNMQTKPVEFVTFDPQMMWMNYEGMTRVFITNCYYSNIYSENKTYELIGENDIYITSVEKCDITKKEFKGNIGDNKYVYLKDINNYYVCHSEKIVNGLYLYNAK